MLALARRNALNRGDQANITFLHAELSGTLPVESDTVDCVISNCVINLLPPRGKARVFEEVQRVLRSGGRVCLSDVRMTFWFLKPVVGSPLIVYGRADHREETAPGQHQERHGALCGLHRGCDHIGGVYGAASARGFERCACMHLAPELPSLDSCLLF